MSPLDGYSALIGHAVLYRRIGWVSALRGLIIESNGPDVAVGELCRVVPRDTAVRFPSVCDVLAEVVGLREGVVTLMPYGATDGVAAGCEVYAMGNRGTMGVGVELLGRVIDPFGVPLDGRPAPEFSVHRPLRALPINPMQRPRIDTILSTGVRVIDTLLTLGKGQRVGIFAGSGVGKSTLLGLLARHMHIEMRDTGPSPVNVIALIGERGREVREFVEKHLSDEGLRRSVVIVATSDQPALARVRAAYAALTVAEYFRDQARDVLLTMDSVTRFAMARREVGLAASEPPTARGYTPSVFAELPELCERCGTSPSGGSITALLTVLVEGDDMNEPIADALRAILDGHIVLSRHLAHRGQYPAIDVLKSASRLMSDLASSSNRTLAADTVKLISTLERNRQMVEIGAYELGSNPALDDALSRDAALQAWLNQAEGGVPRQTAIDELTQILSTSGFGDKRQ